VAKISRCLLRFISNQSLTFGRYLLPMLPFHLASSAPPASSTRVVAVRRAKASGRLQQAVASPADADLDRPRLQRDLLQRQRAKVWGPVVVGAGAYEWIVRTLPRGAKVR
jgi:hypothetical protein